MEMPGQSMTGGGEDSWLAAMRIVTRADAPFSRGDGSQRSDIVSSMYNRVNWYSEARLAISIDQNQTV